MSVATSDCLTEDLVASFYEGRLSEDALARLEAHVDACAECRAWLSTVAVTLDPERPDDERARGGLSFSAGRVIAGRYKIVRFIASGGMGEVYEVDDLQLRERIALKTIRANIADDPQAIERMRREVQLQRKVAHPNVCRMYDLGVDGEGEARVFFLTMELLAGESLAERLRRGPLPPAEALALARELAEALEAAHRAGVLHLDFKSANVILVPDGDGDGARAVVTDFGLARAREGDAAPAQASVAGSPEYMAPEQLQGGALGPATDFYALGVVLFEIVTGTLPFRGETRLATANQRLTEPPPSPRTRAPTLSKAWDAAILRCLDRDPAARPSRAATLLALLAPARTSQPARLVVLASLVALASVLATLAIVVRRPSLPHVRRSFAVLGFRNLTNQPESGWISTALAELLATELSSGGQVRAVSGDSVAHARADISLSDDGRLPREALGRMRTRLDTDWIVAGGYSAEPSGEPGAIRLVLTVEDAATGETLAALTEHGRATALVDLAARAGADLRKKLGLGAVEPTALERGWSSDGAAARLYAEALDAARAYDHRSAEERLRRAVALDPGFAKAHAALADVELGMGRVDEARAEAEKAFEGSAPLPREERLLNEARYRKITRDWPRAITLYLSLVTFYPDELRYGSSLALVQIRAGKSKDALATIAQLRRLPPPMGDDPSIDLRESMAWSKLGDWRKSVELAERAAARATARGVQELVADAEDRAAEGNYYLGHTAKARAQYADAKRIYEALGDRNGALHSATGLAQLQADEGDYAGARQQNEEALAFARAVGNDFDIADQLNAIGQMYRAEGNLTRAKETYQQALGVFDKIGEREGVGNVSNNWADVLLEECDLRQAEPLYRRALSIFRELDMRPHEAIAMVSLAATERREGRLAVARDGATRALAMLRELGDVEKETYALGEDASERREADDLAGARSDYQHALELARQRDSHDDIDQMELALASLAIDEGRADEAAPRLQAMLAARDQARSPAAAAVLEPLVRAVAALGRRDQAAALADEALRRTATSANVELRTTLALTAARAHAAVGGCDRARAEAQEVARVARANGVVDLQLEAALAQASVDRTCARAAQSRRELGHVAEQADALGFRRIARLARASTSAAPTR